MGNTNIRQPSLEDPANLLVDSPRYALHAATASEPSILKLATVYPQQRDPTKIEGAICI
jgi:hypothetical protein